MTYEATMFYSDIEAVKTKRENKIIRVSCMFIFGFTMLIVCLAMV